MKLVYMISWLVWMVGSWVIPVGTNSLDKGRGWWAKTVDELHDLLGLGTERATLISIWVISHNYLKQFYLYYLYFCMCFHIPCVWVPWRSEKGIGPLLDVINGVLPDMLLVTEL